MRCCTSNRSPSLYRRRAGFTLVEMLVVIGVIAVLISLVLPAIVRSRKAAEQAATKQDLNALSVGLEEYKNNYGRYPQTNIVAIPSNANPNVRGPKALFEALSGKTWTTGGGLVPKTDPKSGRNLSPLIQVDKFNVRTVFTAPEGPGSGTELGNWICFRDPDDQPYLYFPALSPPPDITKANLFVKDWAGTGTAPLFNHQDCPAVNPSSKTPYLTKPDMLYLLGDGNKSPPYPTAAPQDGAISTGETASTTGPYILWAAGADRSFGLSGSQTDDVTNFEFPSIYRK